MKRVAPGIEAAATSRSALAWLRRSVGYGNSRAEGESLDAKAARNAVIPLPMKGVRVRRVADRRDADRSAGGALVKLND
ncbi:MAG TPA: hypothetical protein VK047_16720 [Zeimonas sp.]|nr:hypothetical protein [Zeimonas sp.]